jgi:hypothetical protein
MASILVYEMVLKFQAVLNGSLHGTSMMRSAFDHRYQEETLSGISGYSPRLGLLPQPL